MLQLQTKNLDISRVSKILVKYNVKASITNQVLTLEGDISDNLLKTLCNEISFNTIQNYKGVEGKKELNEEYITSPKALGIDKDHETNILLGKIEQYDLLFPEVKEGEIYWCDFGQPYGSETGYKRPAIIVKNNAFDSSKANCTIVIPCSTAECRVLTDYSIIFDETNVIGFDQKNFGRKGTASKIMCADIKTVNKNQLRQFIGTLVPEVMAEIKSIISETLNISEVQMNQYELNNSRNLNLIQAKLLSLVDINELIRIAETNESIESKIFSILQIFGFNFEKKGLEYLADVIKASVDKEKCTLTALCEIVSEEIHLPKEEIMRLVVARVKEQFVSVSKKAPTIDFIKLIKMFVA